ncbi:hypothetical protein OG883_34440 [Streptomyces sp. NBC_01142]|uniref:hypothetical protein n=1 Tax=Streptomyces sp. NBC_01142 TaxID=2975865 RepID=UPI0022569B7F|nr:hypothetical protein [Streptomyces sp. NBC_01142]MCX4824866.1 hypothetical protein [Streptomyces sp. NBC_01142]
MWPIRRPTEHAALRAVDRSERRLPPVPALFSHLVVATAIDDQHGMNLFAHAIARLGGEVGE